MIDTTNLSLFLAASFVLLVVPGPAVLYIVARSVDQGRTAGLVSVLGIGAGSMVHVFAAAIGLSSLLVRSATLFSVVKWAGAAYLVYLGVRRIRGRDEIVTTGEGALRSRRRLFVEGMWVNILNPKTALFFFAFLPQFVAVDAGAVTLQIIVLGAIFVTMGVVSDGIYALAAGTFGDWLKRKPGLLRSERYASGGMLIALGVATAVTGSRK